MSHGIGNVVQASTPLLYEDTHVPPYVQIYLMCANKEHRSSASASLPGSGLAANQGVSAPNNIVQSQMPVKQSENRLA